VVADRQLAYAAYAPINVKPGGGGYLTFSRKILSKSTPQGHHHWSKNGNNPYLRKSILAQKTVIFTPSEGWENFLVTAFMIKLINPKYCTSTKQTIKLLLQQS
jgi:hypothetical protein